MFYSQHVLTKKGPLAKIWLAAHMQSKLTKAMVFGTDVEKAVDSIISPDAPMALRLTSNLLLGVVRILHRKTKYLLQESSDALTKLKLTFRPASTSVDLPATNTAANFAAVTLADASVDDLAAPMVDLSRVPARPARPSATSAFLAADRDITIDEFAGGLSGGMLDAFALEPELDRDQAAVGLDLADLADAHEPLLFTPSQRPSQRVSDTPRTPSVKSAPSSVEVMRAEPVSALQKDGEAPVLSVERERAEDGDPVLPGSPGMPTPPVMAEGLDKTPDLGQSPAAPSFSGDADGDIGMAGEASGDAVDAEGAPAVGRISTGSDELALADDGEELPPSQIGGTQATAASAADAEPEDADVPLGDMREEAEQGQVAPDDVAEKGPTEQDDENQAGPGTEEAPTGRGRKRKRVLIEDPTTELSTRDFRAFLSDTSDLLRQPNSRRRIDPAIRQQGRRAPLRYEELLSRPAIPLAPQLNELFAAAFQIDDSVRQVGSPMSDADLLGDNEKDTEKEGEGAEGEDAPEPSPQKSGQEAAVDDAEESADAIARSQTEGKDDGEKDDVAKATQTPSKPVVADMFPVSPLPEGEEPLIVDTERRRSSFGQGSSALPDYGEEDEQYVFDSSRCYLKDVAMTRSQVEHDPEAGENTDVTESTISARTRKMQEYIREHVNGDGELNYTEALQAEPGVNRRVASRTLYELLNLSSKKALQLSQDGYYGTICARPVQPAFDMLAAARNE